MERLLVEIRFVLAAAEVVVQEIFQPEFLEETVEKGNYLINELKKQLQGVDEVVEVRGLGINDWD